MIGPVFAIDSETVSGILSNTLPTLVLGMALAAVLGWGLARLLANSFSQIEDQPHSILRHLPITPMLLLGIFIIPYVDLNVLFSAIFLGILAAPMLLMLALRYDKSRGEDTPQAQLTQRAILRSGMRVIVMPGFVSLVSGIVYYSIVPAMRDEAHQVLSTLIVPLLAAMFLGAVIGSLLVLLHNWLAAILERRHQGGEFNSWIDGSLGLLRSTVEGLLTQFHGTRLVTVLAISAAVLPYSTAPQAFVLTLLLIPPAASATLAAGMVDDPPPNMPGIYQHIRTGLAGMAQIGVGYLIGVAMLAPLADVREWMVTESDATLDALQRHLNLTFTSLVYSMLLGIGGGILSSRVANLRVILTNLGNIGRTIPSLAVLALALPLFGVGVRPSVIALVFIGTLPILVNTTIGIIEVSQDVREAARGMGMSEPQVLLRVEIPIAVPVIMAGIRTSAVLVVASATLAAFIGGGGLGELIIRGQGSGNQQILFAGAILATILAIFLEYLFGWLETIITPRGLRES